MRLAFTVWGLAPVAFWAMTPRELAACLASPAAGARLERTTFETLMRRYPDHA
jgi:uncharacterized phage protein (TIGR02216 family)